MSVSIQKATSNSSGGYRYGKVDVLPEEDEMGVGRLAFGHPALLLYLDQQERILGKGNAVQGQIWESCDEIIEEHPVVTMLLACFIELERRGYVELRTTMPGWDHLRQSVVWITKKSGQIQRKGLPAQLFGCITHAHSPVRDIVQKFVAIYGQDPWNLVTSIGKEEARSYGYYLRQTWPKVRPLRWLSRVGVSSDTETVWVRNGVKVRTARLALWNLRHHLEEFEKVNPECFAGLRSNIVEGLSSLVFPKSHPYLRLPHLRRRPAY